MIPTSISHGHIMQAISQIDCDGIPSQRRAKFYDLMIEGKAYPPKYVISIAAFFASGQEYPWEKFNAVEAKEFLASNGYVVTDRRI